MINRWWHSKFCFRLTNNWVYDNVLLYYIKILIERHHSRLNGKPSSGRQHVLALHFILTVKCSTLKESFVNESDSFTTKLKHEVAVKLKTEGNLDPIYLQQKSLRKTFPRKLRCHWLIYFLSVPLSLTDYISIQQNRQRFGTISLRFWRCITSNPIWKQTP